MPGRNTFSENEGSLEKIISVIVIVYNMAREAPRTLHTLTPEYQGIDSDLYEIIVMDNGSNPPLGKERVESMSDNFRYEYIDDAPGSPSYALNKAAKLAQGKLLGFMIDGARMLSPGILKYAIRAYHAYQHPAIITLGFHLGSKFQPDAVREGYDQEKEDKLLNSVNWRENGYELFNISCFAESSRHGWFGPISESNCIFIKNSDWDITGGFDESFNMPGGGMVNLDFYSRVCTNEIFEPVIILGEGNFHQFHNGSMTGKTRKELMEQSIKLEKQYSNVRNKKYQSPSVNCDYIGHLPDSSYKFLQKSIEHRGKLMKKNPYKAKLSKFISNNSILSALLYIYRRYTI